MADDKKSEKVVHEPGKDQPLTDEPNGNPTDKQKNRTKNTSVTQEQDPTSLTPSAGQETDWTPTDEGEDTSQADAVKASMKLGQKNYKLDTAKKQKTGAERDGTAKFENVEDAAEARQESLKVGTETAEENLKHEDDDASGAERDGTAEGEVKQNAYDSRQEAIRAGKETAQRNIKAEKKENQPAK